MMKSNFCLTCLLLLTLTLDVAVGKSVRHNLFKRIRKLMNYRISIPKTFIKVSYWCLFGEISPDASS